MRLVKAHVYNVSLFPEVTCSRKRFVEHIMRISREYEIEEKLQDLWIMHFRTAGCEANYFEGLVWTRRLCFYSILHEFFHHIFRIFKFWTRLEFFDLFDILLDDLDIAISRKKVYGQV